MKTSKLFTIDTELAEKLSKYDNASALVNSLLYDHFAIRPDKNTLFEQKRALMSNLKKKPKILGRKLKFWGTLRNLISIIFALPGSKKSGETENQRSQSSRNTPGGEV